MRLEIINGIQFAGCQVPSTSTTCTAKQEDEDQEVETCILKILGLCG